jgi:hypothetical protein
MEFKGYPPRKHEYRGLILKILSTVERIEPLIHRSRFSGNYNYGQVEEALGKLKVDDKYRKRAIKRNYSYGKKAYRNFQSGKAVFFFKTSAPYNDPKKGYLKPPCIFETSDATPDFLTEIALALPDLKATSLEYAIDFYCQNHHQVSDLFWLLRRCSYIPRSKKTSMIGGEFNGYDYGQVEREFNAVYKVHFQEKKVGKKISSGKYVKFYERGDDQTKKTFPNGKKYWDHKDTNRVRFEVTFHRKNGTLERNGIKTLEDLVKGPQFRQIIFPSSFPEANPRTQDQLQFKNFVDRKGKKPPKLTENYRTPDLDGNIECFMNEYLLGKEVVGNISRATEPMKVLEGFKGRIIEATKLFDKKWENSINH